MRAVLFAAALSACTTPASTTTGPDAMRGCWIERRGENTVTQRWFSKGDGWQGDELTYLPAGDPDPVRWRLRPGGARALWLMCMVELSMASSPPCWRATFGPGAADGDDTQWVEIDAAAETLRIAYVTAGERMVTFDGRRDGCD